MDAELRKDLIANRWVLISPRRGKRPHDYKIANANLLTQTVSQPGPCNFCYEHEHETGPELLAFHNAGCLPNQPCWRVRVVQNKFPAVSSDLAVTDCTDCTTDGHLLHKDCILPGFGSHEVVIETPEHNKVYSTFSVDQISEILRAYQLRLEALRGDHRYKYCQIFKNNGKAAGASMSHSHSQIIALPVVPKTAEDEFEGAKEFYEESQKCVFCEIVKFDLANQNIRLIDQSPLFISMSPFAARFPYETWILPRNHNSNFGTASQDEINGLAEMLKLTLSKMDQVFDFPPFNFMLQTAPLQTCDVPYYHWLIRVVPHLVSLAGFELGSGCHINPVVPEQAAEVLRGVKLGESEDPESNGDNSSGTHDTTTPQKLINMANEGMATKKEHEKEPENLIYMADLDHKDLHNSSVQGQKLIYMADLDQKGPQKSEVEPQRLVYMADLGSIDHQPKP